MKLCQRSSDLFCIYHIAGQHVYLSIFIAVQVYDVNELIISQYNETERVEQQLNSSSSLRKYFSKNSSFSVLILCYFIVSSLLLALIFILNQNTTIAVINTSNCCKIRFMWQINFCYGTIICQI